MQILELRENQEIMQQQQLTGQQQWQQQQQQIPLFQIPQQQSMLYPATTTNKLRLSASPSGGGCIPVDVSDGSDSCIPRHQQQQQLQLSTVSENGDATIDELFNADNGSDGVEIYGGGGTDTLEKQFDFGIASGNNQGQDQGNSQMDITDPMESFELFL